MLALSASILRFRFLRLELAGYRSLFALITVALLTRREGFGLNRLTSAAAILYAVLVILFVMATKQTTAANAIFLQYTAPVYMLILEPIVYKEKFRARDLITVLVCIGAMALFFSAGSSISSTNR